MSAPTYPKGLDKSRAICVPSASTHRNRLVMVHSRSGAFGVHTIVTEKVTAMDRLYLELLAEREVEELGGLLNGILFYWWRDGVVLHVEEAHAHQGVSQLQQKLRSGLERRGEREVEGRDDGEVPDCCGVKIGGLERR